MAKRENIIRAYERAVEQLFSDKTAFADYLDFSGRFYKMPSSQTIMLYDDNPNAKMVADYDTWQQFGRRIKPGGWSTDILDNGKIKRLFDISMTRGEKTPYQWSLNKKTAEEFADRLSKSENYDFTGMSDCIYHLSANAVSERIEAVISLLDITEKDEELFRRSFSSMVRRVVASRCEWNSDFTYGGTGVAKGIDLSALDLLDNSGDMETLLEEVQITAKNVLKSMEKSINDIIFERSIDNERNERIDRARGNDVGRGSSQGMVRGGEAIPAVDNDAERKTVQAERGDVRVRSDDGAVLDERGTGADERADKPLGQGVAEIYDGELPLGYPEAARETSLGSDSAQDRQGSVGDHGENAGRISDDEPAPDVGERDGLGGAAESADAGADIGKSGERSEDGAVIPENDENTLTAENSSAVNYLSLRIAELSDSFVQKYDGDYKEFTLANYTFNYALTHTDREYDLPEYDLNLSVRDNVEKMLRNGQHSYLKEYLDAIFKEAFEGRVIVDEGTAAGEIISQLSKLRTTKTESLGEPVDDEPEQLTLFGDYEPVETVPTDNTKSSPKKSAIRRTVAYSNAAPNDEMIDYILKCGGNDNHTLERIVAQFQKGKSDAENADFLCKEFCSRYDEDGRGYKYVSDDFTSSALLAAWFDKDGITAAINNTAFPRGENRHLSWEQVSEKISALLERGEYCEQDIIDRAADNEFEDIAAKLWYIHQDFSEEYRDRNIIPYSGIFTDDIVKIKSELADKNTLQSYIDGMEKFIKDYEENREILRFGFHRPKELLSRLKDLQIPRKEFLAKSDFKFEPKFFITEDEKDWVVKGGGNQGSKFRIAKYFSEGHSAKEKADFVKNEYGEGGSLVTGYGTSYNAKGFKFHRGSVLNPDAEVLMKWSDVVERIERMIADERYITQKDIDARIRNTKRDFENYGVDNEYDKVVKEDAQKILAEYGIDPDAAKAVDVISENAELDEKQKQFLERADELDITNIPSDLDKFYVDRENERVTWVYFNPDSDAGGQLVYNRFTFDDIFDAIPQNNVPDYLESVSRQEAVDITAPNFEVSAREFLGNTEDINSRDNAYLDKLAALTEPYYYIFQLKNEEQSRDYRFAGMSELRERGLYVDRENYTRVYRERIQNNETLDDIFTKFNVNIPADFRGHSLSVGDVIGVRREGKPTAYYVDSAGFTEIPDWLISREERKARRTLTDNLVLIAENQLASDEMDTLGDKLFDYENAPRYKGNGGNWLIGSGTTADKFEEITARYHNGEDVRAELAKGMYTDYGKLGKIEFFDDKDGIDYVNIETSHDERGMTFKTKGGFEITYSWEQLGDAMITAARKEFDRHETLNKAYREDCEKYGNLYLALRDGRTIYLNRADENDKKYTNYRLESAGEQTTGSGATYHSTIFAADDENGERVQLNDFGSGNYYNIIHTLLENGVRGRYEVSSIEREPVFKVEKEGVLNGEASLKSYIKSNGNLLPGEILYSGSTEDCEKYAEWLRLGENSQAEIKGIYRAKLDEEHTVYENVSQGDFSHSLTQNSDNNVSPVTRENSEVSQRDFSRLVKDEDTVFEWHKYAALGAHGAFERIIREKNTKIDTNVVVSLSPKAEDLSDYALEIGIKPCTQGNQLYFAIEYNLRNEKTDEITEVSAICVDTDGVMIAGHSERLPDYEKFRAMVEANAAKAVDKIRELKAENVSQSDFSHSVTRELSIGDQFRNTATGEVSKVTELRGAERGEDNFSVTQEYIFDNERSSTVIKDFALSTGAVVSDISTKSLRNGLYGVMVETWESRADEIKDFAVANNAVETHEWGVHQVVTFDYVSGTDEKYDYRSLSEAVEAANGYVKGTKQETYGEFVKYDGAAVLNKENLKIEHTVGEFDVHSIFSEEVLKANGIDAPDSKTETTEIKAGELSIGDQFRNTATGEVSKVTELRGALPWYTDDCTVVRESGGFIITENIGKKELLDGGKFEFIGNERLNTEEMMAGEISYNKRQVITAERIGDFYEFYGETAKELSEKFNLTLTTRNGEPMVGVPAYRFDDFCGELYDKGYIVENWRHYQEVIKPRVEKNPSMVRAETLINEFCEREYNSEGDFTNRLRVGLAYTDDEETGYPIEVYADLEYNWIITEFNNVIVSEEKYKSLDEMCDLALEHLDFDDLVYLSKEKRDKVFIAEKTKDVSPVTQLSGDVISDFRAKTDEHYKKLAGYSAHNVEELAKQYIRGAIRENGLDAEVGEVVLCGSRCRGMEHNGSDLDFVAEIHSDLKEDALFNILHETPFEIGGAAVDINPIRTEETGSLEDYLLGAERYLQQKGRSEKNASEVQDYHIEETEQTTFGPKTRYAANVAAIKTLNKIESENRAATPDEQKILAQYVGWGGIPQAFDSDNAAWSAEYSELKELLAPDEYEAARSTVLTAHYTSPTIISAIYSALDKFGFKGGNVLEPAMGIGNFFGVMPEEMRSHSQMHGVELDDISGRIAKQLYPNADIQICGYENTAFSDNFFDAAVGNVPFGNYSVSDTKYNRENFLIHDYFFAKTLDKVAPGGVVAFITSKGTLDKESPKVREYLAKRADLIGAIRLSNNAFKANAGTEVTADIIFLQKREKLSVEKPDWCYTAEIAEGISVNQYFVDHPEMILGEMKLVSGRYGEETACIPIESADLKEQLDGAVMRLRRDIITARREEKRSEEHGIIPATADVRNFTFTEVNDKIYFRENNIMREIPFSKRNHERMRGMIGIRKTFRELVDAQAEGCTDETLSGLQSRLNAEYDAFVMNFGHISDIENRKVFAVDDDYNTLCGALELIDPETKSVTKADIFTKRTIKPYVEVTRVDTPQEALFVSLDVRGKVDIEYMAELCETSNEDVIHELTEGGFIYKNPETEKYEEAAEYLSGYVREKLRQARDAAAENPEYERNVAALERALPPKLGAGDISVRLGAPWITIKDYCNFFKEYAQGDISETSIIGRDTVLYRSVSGEYKINNKNADKSVAALSSFGTKRMNSYAIFENLLNNRDIAVYDTFELPDGKKKRVMNKDETQLAQEKARQMKEAFPKWLWSEPERREKYVEIYNELFNSLVGREYDGSHQTFPGMNPFIELTEHQKNAVMRCKLGGNTLLAHCVGAGKTFEMAAAVMEKRRLGLINKACIVVPKHLVGQMSAEWLRLYPEARLLTAKENDFNDVNRQKFIGRCCTGNYDAVIMSYQQFQKIPMSIEYQQEFLTEQLKTLTEQLRDFNGKYLWADEKRSVKDLERMKKNVETKLKKLLDTPHDNSLNFEQLGFDCIVTDEAHNYKNGLVVTKMKNVSGIGSKAAKKSEDFLMKTRYLNEKFGERNLILASGTPVSNSMTELYIMQQYLRPSALQRQGLQNFDDWASTFGEVVSQLELKPAGDGFRMKKRFAKFTNLPELMQTYKDFADIRTAEMLNLPVPEIEGGKPQVISAKPNEFQTAYMKVLAERSEAIHNGSVDPSVDNMLKVTNEARLLGLDARTINPDADNYTNSKVNLLIAKVMEIYTETTEQKGVQAIFCDIAINDGKKDTSEIDVEVDDGESEKTLSAEEQAELLGASKFSVYKYVKEELIRRGIPETEICFAGDAKDQGQRGEMYAQLRAGTKRIVLASTTKMGTGANIQTRLCALHNLDIPWKPSDFEQRIGRIVRQGNKFPTVKIFNYVTEGTFDAYMLNLIVTKQKFISQLMSGKTPARTCEDVDELVLNYSEMQAIASGDPRIKEKIQLDTDVSRLRLLENEHLNKKYQLEDKEKFCEAQISIAKKQLALARDDKEFAGKNILPEGEFKIVINGKIFTERKDAGTELRKAQMSFLSKKQATEIGEYRGFKMSLNWGLVSMEQYAVSVTLTQKVGKGLTYSTELELQNDLGNITRLENILKLGIDKRISGLQADLARNEKDLAEVLRTKDAPFEYADELAQKSQRLARLDAELGVGKKDEVVFDEGESQDEARGKGRDTDTPGQNKKPKRPKH